MFPGLNWVSTASSTARAPSPAFIQHPDSEFRTAHEPRAHTPTPSLGSIMREHPRARTTSTTTNTSSAVLDLDWSLVGPPSGTDQPAQNFPRRHRASLLGAASGALAGRLSRRKTRAQARPPSPTKEPAVRAADVEEAEERNRLRDAAAQSLGLELTLPVGGRVSSEGEHSGEHADAQVAEERIQAPVTPTLPAFPATKTSLAPLVVLQTALPKHYPPPSLLKRALAHQWKTRTVILTGPPTSSRTGGGTPSHLHVFRIGSGNERELERLAIDERSVVFVADEDEGGRAHVVKVGGHDVGARRRELNGEESGMTMMWLQIVDAQESRAWIGAIKAAVLGQRSVRAGLGNSYGSSSTEPRGDLDVVLSMRMQGMGARPAPSDSSQSQASSTSSTRPNSPRPTISFKGLFGNSRPRSLSRATSVASNDDPDPVSPTADSFASVANSIMAQETPYARRIVHNRTSVDLDYEDALSARATSPPPLGPPPTRRRAHASSAPEPLERDGRIYTFGNTSFGDARVLTPVEDSPSLTPVLHTPPTPIASPQSPTGLGKQRASSVSSVSTLGGASDRRRWSRQSALATLSAKSTSPPQRHPYAAVDAPQQSQAPPQARSSSRASTSTTSHRTLPGILAIKRASTSSAASASLSNDSSLSHSHHSLSYQPTASGSGASSNSYSHTGTNSLLSPTGTVRNRQSMPPPQRPAPNTALPPTPSDPPRPEMRPRSMSARPGTAPGAVSSAGSFSLIGAPSALQAVAQVKAGSKLRLSLHGKTPPTTGSTQEKPHRRTTSSGADVPCARPPPSGPLPPPPPESKRGSLPPESKRGSWNFEPKRGSLTMSEHRRNTSIDANAKRSSLDAKRGLGISTLESPPAAPESPTIASSIVQRLRMFGGGGGSNSAMPSRSTTPAPPEPSTEVANESSLLGPSLRREVDLSGDLPVPSREVNGGPIESDFSRERADSNGGPILLAPSLLRALDGDASIEPSLLRQRADSQALPLHPPPPRVADLQAPESSNAPRPGSPGFAERITDPRVALAAEAAADAERERLEQELLEREREMEALGLEGPSDSVPSSPTGAPVRPPRSARRPPPRTSTSGSGSDSGPVTALAPPPRRRPATASGLEARGGEDYADPSGRMLRLPEDARSDLGRANFSRLSLLLADAGP